jgi:hypothetical protein
MSGITYSRGDGLRIKTYFFKHLYSLLELKVLLCAFFGPYIYTNNNNNNNNNNVIVVNYFTPRLTLLFRMDLPFLSFSLVCGDEMLYT